MAAISAIFGTPTADTLVPTVTERCILIRMENNTTEGTTAGIRYEAHLVMGHVAGPRFVTLDTDLVLDVVDLAGEGLIPLACSWALSERYHANYRD